MKRSQPISKLLVAFMVGFGAPAARGAQHENHQPKVECIGITVSDVNRLADFYSRVLSFRKVAETEGNGPAEEAFRGVVGLRTRTIRMSLGSECIELTEYLAPRGRGVPEDTKSNDGSFQHIAIVVSDMDRAYAWLQKQRIEHVSSSPQRLPDWNPNAGGICAFYFRDPDRHTLEIIRFPRGKGDRRWQRVMRTPSSGAKPLFLGIDHTAIVVSDTVNSLRFYVNTFGMHVAGTSENFGAEQEHLNNVPGAHLRITSLRGDSGPGIELLEYLSPRAGRPIPADEKANDVFHWQTRVRLMNLRGWEHTLQQNHVRFVSPHVVELGPGTRGFSFGLMVRDPDGHVLELVQ